MAFFIALGIILILIAPFNGIHGWYWRNQGETPVTLTLKTSGFYRKLIRPPVS